MRVLVTGATGRIGRRVVRDLLSRQLEVVAIANRPENLPAVVRCFGGELVEQPALVDRLVRDVAPDAVIHLAALAGAACELRPEEAQARNVGLTHDLARAAADAGVPRFVFSSTSAVYHQRQLWPTTEDENVAPDSVYGRTKLAAEEAVAAVAERSSTSFTTLRIFNVYGPGMDASLCERLLQSSPRQPVELTGWRHFYRDYMHADEAAQALVLAALAPERAGTHQVMNIGSGIARNNAELVAELELLGARPVYRRVEGADRPSYSWADVTRAVELIGYRPTTDLLVA